MGGSQEIADAAAAAMFAEDRNARAMGMIVSAVTPGSATVEMTVLESMANGLDVCHGGVVFALADTAMAFASNARGGTNLASNASIEWLAPARVDDRLVAEASETHHQGRTGVYGVVVSGPEGVVAAIRASPRSTEAEKELGAPFGDGQDFDELAVGQLRMTSCTELDVSWTTPGRRTSARQPGRSSAVTRWSRRR